MWMREGMTASVVVLDRTVSDGAAVAAAVVLRLRRDISFSCSVHRIRVRFKRRVGADCSSGYDLMFGLRFGRTRSTVGSKPVSTDRIVNAGQIRSTDGSTTPSRLG
ncbi:hypothetical protein HanRHA438_Chr05g0232021 [Helianthus annuus]|uniref:Uncharacterized protein n=2 Tax=Helianthus annuus TaxID=4232 RepID=A0A9K3J1F1_HELAN|nr:hypothetical protein HanXRQr2_Chr05g0222941 [Helianthus annuus]KAJ0585165.1 hypothetical protein HanHA89_Chr05g0197161 [Helianthus annuus]KAJ0919648.1 hypothetical protein HanRHA438_Chr05g0232021 [Helianthus annuus]